MTEHNFEQMRRAMVASQLRTTGINDPRVLAAMGEVQRERFVPADRVPMAYADALVPLGNGRELNSPMSTGRILTEAAPQEGERALLIGAATGYTAAVLARLTGPLVAVEEDPALLEVARRTLQGSGVELVEGPLTAGYAEGGPYDVIVVDGAVEFVPEALVAQLVDGGRIGLAHLERGVARIALGRRAGGGFGIAPVSDVATTILPGFMKPRTFTF